MHLSFLLLALFVVLQIADAWTTYRGLSGSSGRISEANPLARWAFDRFGLVGPIVALKAAMSALGAALALSHTLVGTLALAALTALGAWVVWNNLRALARAD